MADPCVYCYGQSVVLDHVIPASRGGADDWTNRAPCCEKCDKMKALAGPVMMLSAMAKALRRSGKRYYANPNLRERARASMIMKICRRGMFDLQRQRPSRWAGREESK